MWPEARALATDAPPVESPHLLSWVLGLPIAGAVAVLFAPRQAHRTLRWMTLGVMLATLAAALP